MKTLIINGLPYLIMKELRTGKCSGCDLEHLKNGTTCSMTRHWEDIPGADRCAARDCVYIERSVEGVRRYRVNRVLARMEHL